jgi:L-ascorbate metabolism protein UlaG (beta-lactamase superfamily)
MTKNRLLSGILLVIVIAGFVSCKTMQVPSYEGDISDHFDGNEFYNPPPFEMGSFKELRKYYKKNKKAKWYFTEVDYKEKLQPFAPKGEILFTHINHSTVLIQMDSLNILTDPIFSERASPFGFAGPKRFRHPAYNFEDLPKIHYVLLSHDHYDHLDIKTLQKLDQLFEPKIIAGLGLRTFLKKFGLDNVVELDWGERKTDPTTYVKFHFLPAVHWSNRGFKPNKTLWGSFMIEGSGTVYFAGDTAYGDHFKKIKSQFPDIDLALIPIGSYVPRSFMKHVHMDPEDAYSCFMDLKPHKAMGIHWGTFQLSGEGMFDPKLELFTLMAEVPSRKINADNFICDEIPGKVYSIKLTPDELKN